MTPYFTMTTCWNTCGGKISVMSWPEAIWKLAISKERQKLSKPMRLENLFNNLSERTNYYETNYFT